MQNSDSSDLEDEISFARQFDDHNTTLNSDESKINLSTSDDCQQEVTDQDDSNILNTDEDDSNILNTQEDDSNILNTQEDDGDGDDDDDVMDSDNYDSDNYDSDGSLIQNQMAPNVNEVDLNNLPERITEKIFQILVNQSKNETTAILSKKFQNINDESEDGIKMETDLLEASLICPLSKRRIEIPARGNECNHLNCFDLKVYLVMNDKKSEWLCPICDKPVANTNLFVDTLFSEILNRSKVDKVQFLTPEDWMECHDTKQSLNISDDIECIVLE